MTRWIRGYFQTVRKKNAVIPTAMANIFNEVQSQKTTKSPVTLFLTRHD